MEREALRFVIEKAVTPDEIMTAVDMYVEELMLPVPVVAYRPRNIMELPDIGKALEEIQTALEAVCDADNPTAVVNRLQILEGYMATSGKMLADAKYQHRQQVEVAVLRAVEKMSAHTIHASTINKYIEALARDAAYIVDWCERVNRACTHGCEFCRTLISKLKEEYRVNNYSGTQGNGGR